MARVHKLLLTLASSSALYSGLVPALGLGNITLHSALNQTLEAEIQLLEADGFTADDVRVRLASEADFSRSGVERIFFLNDLRFTPLFKGNRSVIRVTSSKSIREPYLNFVIELARPGGRILREYTLLIDPPSSSAYRSVAELPSYAPPREAASRPPKQVRPIPVALQGNSYRVVAGDSLWLIAKRLMNAAGPRAQQALMDDIQALNPQAFIAGDSSRLRLGVNLVLPDSAPVPVAEAGANIALSAPDAAATLAAPASTAQPMAAPVAPADILLAQQRVDAELAAQALQNRQLQASMLALQAQLSALQEQVQAKDQQLELLRAESAPEQSLPASSVAPSAAVPVQAPAIVTPSEPQQSWSWWLLAGSGVLLGVFAALLWRVRTHRKEDVEAEMTRSAVSAAALAEPLHLAAMVAPTALASVPTPASVIAPAIIQAPPRVTPAAADALEGANIYIAYGRFSEALGVLRKGVQAEPQRLELRLRMLEVLGELGDGAGFAQEEKILRQQGADSAQLNQLWTRFAHLLVAEPEVVFDDAVLLLDEQPLDEPPPPQAVDDFQLNLEDLSLDADWDSVSPFKAPASTRSKSALMAAVANDQEVFSSDLEHLPEVSEVQLEQHEQNLFAAKPVVAPGLDHVVEDSGDAFAAESMKSVGKTALADLQHLAVSRENLVKLNKAMAYIAQGNLPSACSILNEVISDGDAQQQQQARELLAKIA